MNTELNALLQADRKLIIAMNALKEEQAALRAEIAAKHAPVAIGGKHTDENGMVIEVCRVALDDAGIYGEGDDIEVVYDWHLRGIKLTKKGEHHASGHGATDLIRIGRIGAPVAAETTTSRAIETAALLRASDAWHRNEAISHQHDVPQESKDLMAAEYAERQADEAIERFHLDMGNSCDDGDRKQATEWLAKRLGDATKAEQLRDAWMAQHRQAMREARKA